MKKVLNNLFKWLICVFLTFAVIYTILQMYEIATGTYMILNNEKIMEEILSEKAMLEDIVKTEQEHMDSTFNFEYQDERISQLYNKYPTGTSTFFIRTWYNINYGECAIVAFSLGIIMGTAIYMLQDTDKKGLKIVIILYLLSIVILGFVQGFINIYGENLTLLERWMFPDEYIIPVSIAFALVVGIRFIRQKEIAKKLNEKLQEKTNKSL